MEPSKGHQVMEPSIGHWIGIFFHLLLSHSRHNFWFKSWKYLFSQPSLGGEEWLVLVDGGNKESRFDVYSTFERMEVSRDNVGSLKS
jgi:hypothetical protein